MNRSNRNLLVLGLVALLAAAAAPACGSDSNEAGGADGGTGGGGGTVETGGEDCFNEADDDGDELVDCADPDCFVLDVCSNECNAQVPGCEANQTGRITRVCLDGACAPAGPVSEEGELVRGNIHVYSRLADNLRPIAARNKAISLELIHPERPDGTPATCDALIDAGRFGGSLAAFNVIGFASLSIQEPGDTIPAPAYNMPVSDERGWLVLVRLWGARDRTGQPTGEVVALGCRDGVQMPEGPYDPEDPVRNVTVDVQAVCTRDEHCPEPLTCLAGALLCRDARCGNCGHAGVCREVNGEPICLKTCDPEGETQTCPSNHRCDTTPGLTPACVPLD